MAQSQIGTIELFDYYGKSQAKGKYFSAWHRKDTLKKWSLLYGKAFVYMSYHITPHIDVRNGVPQENFGKMVAMREEGKSYTDIAKEIGIDRARVRYFILRYFPAHAMRIA